MPSSAPHDLLAWLRRYVIRKQLKKSLDSVRVMLAQVYAAMDWLSRNHGVQQAACVLTRPPFVPV
jgi:hypothetical protein